MDKPLTPAEALALAGRATAAAERPIPLPGWYGPGIGAVFLVQGVLVGAAIQFEVEWLRIVGCAMAAPLIGMLAAIAARSSGVAQRPRPGVAKLAVVTVLVIAAAYLAVGGLGWWGGLPMLPVGLVAGATAGGAFWLAMLQVNRQIRRELEQTR
ncbi:MULTISPECIES: hypothetical protein [unclassified Kitasatospora]|uniref:hypothetical protein n=1 Tax=unclassified Kitasatospora TaxID=2633591 RepID=UPI00070FAAB4|nr:MULTISPECIES: hypothetical protein [unclassified Kitasatospora]KQV05553.1 hypothetical protein ASC99_12090 [Kitasatospora sp. Root107]KRB62355.1 hypothetical protein ASE03_07040 [Kitasatospora sp. Root187]